MRRTLLVILCLAAAGALAGLTLASPERPQQNGPSLRLATVARIGGRSLAAAAVGDHVLLGEGGHLLAVSLADPTAPAVVWRSPELGGNVTDIRVEGDLALVAAGTLDAFDVSDPTAPRRLGPFPGLTASAVAVDGTMAYLRDSRQVRAIDISDPARPLETATYAGLSEGIGIAAVGGVVWVADGRGGLRALDASTPGALSEMTLAGDAQVVGDPRCLDVRGDLLVLVGSGSGSRGLVATLDVSDPGAPRLLGEAYRSRGSRSCALVGDRFYLAGAASGAYVYSVTDTGELRELTHIATAAAVSAVVPAGDLLMVADDPGDVRQPLPSTFVSGLHVYRDTVEIGRLETPGLIAGIVVADDRAYVADAASGLHVFDVRDPARPAELGRADTPGIAGRVIVDGDVVLVVDEPHGVRLVDVSDPAAPRPVGLFTRGQPELGLAARDGVGIVVDGYDLVVFGFATPAAPREVGRLRNAGRRLGNMAMLDHLAVVPGEYPRLQIVDLTDPARPAVRGSLGDETYATGLTVDVQGSLAYVGESMHGGYFVPVPATRTPGPSPTGPTATPTLCATAPPPGGRLSVVDMSDPAAPAVLGWSGGFGGAPFGIVRAAGGVVWVVADENFGGLHVLDVSDPTRPVEVAPQLDAALPRWLGARDVAVDRDLVYIASREGVLVLRRMRADGATETATATATAGTIAPTATPSHRRALLPKLER